VEQAVNEVCLLTQVSWGVPIMTLKKQNKTKHQTKPLEG
jgi:hypothetical protein